MMMYGIGHVIRNLDYNADVDHIDLQIILDNLKITYEQFVDLCMLLGTDFNDSICGYGKATSVAFIRNGHELRELSNIMSYDYTLIRDHILNCRRYHRCH